MAKKREKIILLAGMFLFLLVLPFIISAATTTSRSLEVNYPVIPGITNPPKTISVGLPDYVKYIFYFSVSIIGLVILIALIRSGLQYIASTGNPSQLSDAKDGIFRAILGAIVLLSSIILFDTINPKISTFNMGNISTLKPVILPGMYICNYSASGVREAISEYTSNSTTTAIEGAKKLRKIMQNDKGNCTLRLISQNLPFEFKEDYSVFEIPRKVERVDPISKSPYEALEYSYGLIIHEKDNFKGKCKLLDIYDIKPDGIGDDMEKARSITVFKKNEIPPDPSTKGVCLYSCLNYNRKDPRLCPKGTKTPAEECFKSSDNYRKIPMSELDKNNLVFTPAPIMGSGTAYDNYKTEEWKGTRSIKIDPKDSFLAMLFSDDNFGGDTCEVISVSDPNLLAPQHSIGRCSNIEGSGSCEYISKDTDQNRLKRCFPCTKSMVIIKGNGL